MFEGIICGFIIFTVGYLLIMRITARQADVLYGEFIQSDGHRPDKVPSTFAATFAAIQRLLPGLRLPARRKFQ